MQNCKHNTQLYLSHPGMLKNRNHINIKIYTKNTLKKSDRLLFKISQKSRIRSKRARPANLKNTATRQTKKNLQKHDAPTANPKEIRNMQKEKAKNNGAYLLQMLVNPFGECFLLDLITFVWK